MRFFLFFGLFQRSDMYLSLIPERKKICNFFFFFTFFLVQISSVNIIRCTKVRHHQWIRSKGRDSSVT